MSEVAVILAAGGGTRLRPLTDERPKALLEVGAESILHRAARLLSSVGVRELVVATGYRHDAVRAALGGLPAKVSYCHNADFERTQNSVSLYRCAHAVAGRAFFKLDGDVLFQRDVLTRLQEEGAELAVAVERRGDLGAEEMKVITEGASIRSFGKGLAPERCTAESIGIERVSADAGAKLFRALARALEANRTDLYYEDVYNDLIAEGVPTRAVDVTDLAWIEVDTPEDLACARRWMDEGKLA